MTGFSIPYPRSAVDSAWGEPTTKVNFCEDDYLLLSYIAESINSLTSLAYIVYAYYGIRRARRYSQSVLSPACLTYWGLSAVGLFSAVFHGTLKYQTQMADDLSMHLATGLTLHQVYCFNQPPEYQRKVTAIMLGGLIPFAVYHCIADEFLLHTIVFGSMTIIIIRKTRAVIAVRIKTPEDRARLQKLATLGTACASFAYLLWNIDVHLCSYLVAARRQVGMPWGYLLELHGWWHILTAIGAYTMMALIEFLTSPEELDGREMGFAWPVKLILEDIGGESVSADDKPKKAP